MISRSNLNFQSRRVCVNMNHTILFRIVNILAKITLSFMKTHGAFLVKFLVINLLNIDCVYNKVWGFYSLDRIVYSIIYFLLLHLVHDCFFWIWTKWFTQLKIRSFKAWGVFYSVNKTSIVYFSHILNLLCDFKIKSSYWYIIHHLDTLC